MRLQRSLRGVPATRPRSSPRWARPGGADPGRCGAVKIALLAEGSYPFGTGGVSTWCDQLIRGLPEHVFDVVAIVATSGDPTVLDLPPNVGALRRVPLWDWTPHKRRPRPAARAALDGLYRPFLRAMLAPDGRQGQFGESLRQLSDFSRQGNLT